MGSQYITQRNYRAGLIESFLSIGLTALISFGLVTASAPSAFGQAYSASLTGVVTDPQGAVIPGIQVELRNEATAETRVTQTAQDGRYTFSLLKPATYTLTVTAQGFQPFTRKGLTLEAQVSSSVDVMLQLIVGKAEITVSGAAPLLDTQSATQQSTLNSTLIRELPMGVQSPLPLVMGLAGTTNLGMAPNGHMSDYTLDQNLSRFALGGGRDMGNLVLLDGSPDTAADWGGLLVSPAISATQEMQIIRNNYDAQFGKTGGGVVNIVTKGGTEQFHGEAFGFLRNDNLDATSWAGNTYTVCDPSQTERQCNSSKKPEFKRELFGGTIGGPIWRSKRLYFMGTYSAVRLPAGSIFGPTTVPTSLERQGDFSQSYNSDGSLQVLFDPYSTTSSQVPDPNNPGGTMTVYSRTPIDPSCVGVVYPNTCAGNRVATLDPVGSKVAALYPNPNLAGDPITHANNYFATGSAKTLNDHVDIRVDWAHNDKHNMYVRWSQNIRQLSPTPDYFGNGATPVTSANNPSYHVVWGNTFTPTPTWAINVLLGSGRWDENQGSPAQGRLTPASIGMNPAWFQAQLIPPFNVDGYSNLGGGEIRDFIRYEHSLQADVTKEKGAHSIKFGTFLEAAMVNDTDNFTGSTFYFNRCQTAADPQNCYPTGNGLASLLFGVGSGGGGTTFNPNLAIKMPYYGFYAQDAWRATKKLTVTLGLRWDIQPGATERHNRWGLLDLNATNPLASITGLPLKGNYVYANASNRGLWQTNSHDIAPRIGIAYQISPKLVMRAGYGIFYLPASSLIGFDSPGQDLGYSASTSWLYANPTNPYLPYHLLSNPYPNGINLPTGANTDFTASTGQAIEQAWLKGPHPDPYKQNWSLDFQYEFSPASVLEVGYTGFGARKLLFGNPALNPDQLPDQYISLGNAQWDPVANPFYPAVQQYPALQNSVLAGGECPPEINAPSCISRSQLLIPYPAFYYFTITRSLPGATANFHSLWLKYSHRFSGGLTMLSTYQWSKNLDDASEDQGWELGGASSPWRDYYNRKAEYSVSAHDVPQSFVTSLVYDLPFGKGKRFGSGMRGISNAVAGGWQMSGIIRMTSGFPASVNTDWTGAGSTGYANLLGTNLVNVANRTPGPGGQWFNTCMTLRDGGTSGCRPGQQPAWAEAPFFTYGNAPRYISNLRSDWPRNLDFSLAKSFQATERIRLQFRADMFNLFNTPIFGAWLDTYLKSETVGTAWDTNNSSRHIQLGLRVFF